MKSRYYYLLVVAVLFFLVGLVFMNHGPHHHHPVNGFFPLRDRPSSLRDSAEFNGVKREFERLMTITRTNTGDVQAKIRLAALYLQEARVTGWHHYYEQAAGQYIDEVLEKDSANFEALCYRALLSLSQHHFVEGLTIAEKARTNNPDNAFVHGLLVDANVELGHYVKAVEEAEKMIALRPDTRSYSRIAYLREIHGDYPGAIDAMQLAVDAGMPGHEATEWARVQLGKLYELTGDLEKSALQYNTALHYRPGYAFATAGIARLEMAAKRHAKTIAFLLAADQSTGDPSIKEELAEAYELTGDRKKADSIVKQLLVSMNDGHHGENSHRHNGLELAKLYLKTGDLDQALTHVLQEHQRRPKNIEVNELAAWIYFVRDDIVNALKHIDAALSTGSKNPQLLARAAMIYHKNGDNDKAKLLFSYLREKKVVLPVWSRHVHLAGLSKL